MSHTLHHTTSSSGKTGESLNNRGILASSFAKKDAMSRGATAPLVSSSDDTSSTLIRTKASGIHQTRSEENTKHVGHGKTDIEAAMLLQPKNVQSDTIATPTFSIPSPIHPPGISLLDLTAPVEMQSLPAPVTLTPNGKIRNLGLFTRNGRKRDASQKTFSLSGDIPLPPSLNPLSKRQRIEPSDIFAKLKSPISKEAMLPQSTPPFRPMKAKDNVPDIDVGDSDEKESLSPSPTPTSTTEIKSAPQVKQASGNGSGSSCHQCKSRCSLSSLIPCKNRTSLKTKPKQKGCRKKYCDRCLNKFYNESVPSPEQQPKWSCPACRSICMCAACRRQKIKHQNEHKTDSTR
mmetsp:Transcript_25688/g.50040  ORF Transcript_25688/g.50040 Transcript_25688/m.50040 type:complete len:347 (-) Transcript_25688:259-1299(-)